MPDLSEASGKVGDLFEVMHHLTFPLVDILPLLFEKFVLNISLQIIKMLQLGPSLEGNLEADELESNVEDHCNVKYT